MLDGRVLGTSQVEYKPFGKPPLKKKINTGATCVHIPARVVRSGGFYLPLRTTRTRFAAARCRVYAKPLNPHSLRAPCYMCYMCYILHAKLLNPHSPPGPCYMCYMCYILHAKPLNIHSPPAPCYMYYMCYIFCTRKNL